MSFILHKQTITHPNFTTLEIEFRAHDEYTDIYEHYQVAGKDASWVAKQQRNGNQASWFLAQVYVRAGGTDVVSSSQWIGCCSYNSFEEFMQTEYFKEMRVDATVDFLKNIDKHIADTAKTLLRLGDIKRENDRA